MPLLSGLKCTGSAFYYLFAVFACSSRIKKTFQVFKTWKVSTILAIVGVFSNNPISVYKINQKGNGITIIEILIIKKCFGWGFRWGGSRGFSGVNSIIMLGE